MTDVRRLDPIGLHSVAGMLDGAAAGIRSRHASSSWWLGQAGRSNWPVRHLLAVAASAESWAADLRGRSAAVEAWAPWSATLAGSSFIRPQPISAGDGPIIGPVPPRRPDEVVAALEEALDDGHWDLGELPELAWLIRGLDPAGRAELLDAITPERLELLLFGEMTPSLWERRRGAGGLTVREWEDQHGFALATIRSALLGRDPVLAAAVAELLPARLLDDLAVLLVDLLDPGELRIVLAKLLDATDDRPELISPIVSILAATEIPSLHLAIGGLGDARRLAGVIEEAAAGGHLAALTRIFAALDVLALDEKSDGYIPFIGELYEELGPSSLQLVLYSIQVYGRDGNHADLAASLERIGRDLGLLSYSHNSPFGEELAEFIVAEPWSMEQFALVLPSGRYGVRFLMQLAPLLEDIGLHMLLGQGYSPYPPGGDVRPFLLTAFANNPLAARALLTARRPDGVGWLDHLVEYLDYPYEYGDGGAALGAVFSAVQHDEPLSVELLAFLASEGAGDAYAPFWEAAVPFLVARLPDFVRVDARFSSNLSEQFTSTDFIDMSDDELRALLGNLMQHESARQAFLDLAIGFALESFVTEVERKGETSGEAWDTLIGMVLDEYRTALIAEGKHEDEANQFVFDVFMKVVTLAAGTVPGAGSLAGKGAIWLASTIVGNSVEFDSAGAAADLADGVTDAVLDQLYVLLAVTKFDATRHDPMWDDARPPDVLLDADGTLIRIPEPPMDDEEAFREWQREWAAARDAFAGWLKSPEVNAILDAERQRYEQDIVFEMIDRTG